jgi:GNAT superfamily N-acetyltransferase
MVEEHDIAVIEAVLGSDLYRQSLRLRATILRESLGLHLTEEELADDATRQHFCAIAHGTVIGTVSLKPLDEATLQLKQMAVMAERRRERIGARLLSHAEGWGRGAGFLLMVLARAPRWGRGLLRESAISPRARPSTRTPAPYPHDQAAREGAIGPDASRYLTIGYSQFVPIRPGGQRQSGGVPIWPFGHLVMRSTMMASLGFLTMIGLALTHFSDGDRGRSAATVPVGHVQPFP